MPTPKELESVQHLVHTPAELAMESVQYAERIQEHPGVKFGIQAIDESVIPMRPGDLVTLIARPGHCKTSLMALMAQNEAKNIVSRGTTETEAVVYVTWEQSAEELDTIMQTDGSYSISDVAWGRVNLKSVRAKSVHRARLPIWIIGHGIGRSTAASGKGIAPPRMTPDVVLSALLYMKRDFGKAPSLMLFDYLQLIPVHNVMNKVQQVSEMPNRIKELALRVGCPAVCGVQAKREVDNTPEKIPTMSDGQWASAIEQTSDKTFSLMRPIRYFAHDHIHRVDEMDMRVTEELFIIRLLKQRGEAGRRTFLMNFQPQYLRMSQQEIPTTDFNKHMNEPYREKEYRFG
jgi:replicative DNA helicase